MSGYTPNIMRAARKLNDEMSDWVVNNFLEFIKKEDININSNTITLMGYTFKENCSDVRNTKVYDLSIALQKHHLDINIWDPFLTKETQEELSKKNIKSQADKPIDVQLAFVCVYHDQILEFLESYKGITYDYRKLNLNK